MTLFNTTLHYSAFVNILTIFNIIRQYIQHYLKFSWDFLNIFQHYSTSMDIFDILDVIRHYSTLFDTSISFGIFQHFDYSTLSHIDIIFRHYSTFFDILQHFSTSFTIVFDIIQHYSSFFALFSIYQHFDSIQHYLRFSWYFLNIFRHYSTSGKNHPKLYRVPSATLAKWANLKWGFHNYFSFEKLG